MKTIAILNLKGGVGKTVTAINMSAILAMDYSKRVNLIDADSQGNTTEFFGASADVGSLTDILVSRGNGESSLTEIRGLDVLASTDELMDLDLTKITGGQVNVNAISELAVTCFEEDMYDYLIIDCPPAFSAATVAALIAADEVIIPMKLDAFSLRGMANLMRQIENMRRVNPRLRVAGVLPTMYYTSAHMINAQKTLMDSALPCYSPIRRSPKVDEMTFEQEPLCIYSPRSAAGIDYRGFVLQYLKEAENYAGQ